MISSPTSGTPRIVLATLNAKYIHASLGLRYLLANMGELKPHTTLCEFTIARQAEEIVAELLSLLSPAEGPQIIGFGVYIWNVKQTTEVIRLLKTARPELMVVLGGPEVSHELDGQDIVQQADHVITGWGDISFAQLCRDLFQGHAALPKVITGEQPPLNQLALPYAEYTDADLAHRVLYVEASRGCPFKCEFCLSALDKSAWAFDLETFLDEMKTLYQRGARNFKFVDRTFNLKTETSVRLLAFFLERLPDADGELFVHFEVVPDHLPEPLKQLIAQFPPRVLQFEVGVQSFNSEVQQRISRRQDNYKTEINLRWLREQSNAHLHADLIFGLPGETLESFAAGFDRLYALQTHEIQLGLLKRLRGTPISRHTLAYGMKYDSQPPYTVLETGAVDSATMQRFVRFSRYWDKLANSGRFRQSVLLLLANRAKTPENTHDHSAPTSAFHAFLDFSDWLWAHTKQTRDLTPEALIDALYDYLCDACGCKIEVVQQALLFDYVASGARGNPRALHGLLPKRTVPTCLTRVMAQRQERHRSARQTAD
ncbi:MAG: DUF4080 domain-containing protein [Betaproteobacteria bacterium]